jgi:YVTN family beta-propeller protein
MIRVFKKISFLLIISSLLFLQACEKTPDPVIKTGEAGFFIINEGAFGKGNSSISFYDRKTDEVTNDIFFKKNGSQLGDQAQSMTIHEGKGYIIVQGDKKVKVIDPTDFTLKKVISSGIENPRYYLGISASKAYISDWGADGLTGSVKVYEPIRQEVISKISTGKGANKMLLVGNFVYVANSGGFGKDSTVKVIDITTDKIVASITTGNNPNSLQIDKDGNIWVTSSGANEYDADFNLVEAKSTKGSISKISGNKEVLRLTVDKFAFSNVSNLNMSVDGTTLYYSYDGSIYSMNISATALPTLPLIAKDYYGLALDPFNGNLIACDAPTFTSAGNIDVYDTTGKLLKTYAVGIAPNGCSFK